MDEPKGIRKSCFAYANDTQDGCNALKKLYCKTEKCNFYKPKCQVDREED